MTEARIDLIGQRIGRLTITGYIGRAKRRTWWHAMCDCGQATISTTDALRRKVRPVSSCGCLLVDSNKARFAALRAPAGPFGKECKACGAVKPQTAFYERADSFDGLHHICKPCFIADIRARRDRQRAAA